jgi:DNA-binding NtrC family response regulator
VRVIDREHIESDSISSKVEMKDLLIASAPVPPALEGAESLPTILLVDDRSGIPTLCSETATRVGLHVITAPTATDALDVFQREPVDIVIADITVPDIRGMELIQYIHINYPRAAIVVLTKYGTIETAVEAMQLGAIDFFTRPFDLTDFRQKLASLAEGAKLERIRRSLGQQLGTAMLSSALVGRSLKMQEIQETILKTSHHDYPVLILGESGTGKELVARSIHYSGSRRKSAFVPVDCASLTPSLIESELFGHERGAFTGAFEQKTGMFEAAHNGTLFLDEIGELPKELQAKLLRVIQEKVVRRVGSTQLKAVDIRIIAATNRDLICAVRAGEFREDLYYRLNVVQLKLPPLRHRKADIPLLVAVFIDKHQAGLRPIERVAPDAWSSLLAHSWPGNVRELENAIESALALGSGPVLRAEDFSAINQMGESAPQAMAGQVQSLESLEKSAIFAALQATQGDKIAAADILGIGKTTLYRKLKVYHSHGS